jgi:hypothetical protein
MGVLDQARMNDLTPRQRAQLRSVALNGRPIGTCLRRCDICCELLHHVGLSHFCRTCAAWRSLTPGFGCDDIVADRDAKIRERRAGSD